MKILELWLRVNALNLVTLTSVFQSAVNVATTSPVNASTPEWHIEQGDPANRALLYRFATRETTVSMPPLGTNVVDVSMVMAVSHFITSLE